MSQPHAPLVLDRRKFLASAAGLIAAGVIPRSALALAQPYKLKIGTFDATIVSDGHLFMPWTVIAPDAPPDELRKLLSLQLTGDTVVMEANLVVLRSSNEVILVDAGAGSGFQQTAGKLGGNLELAGITPGMVTHVVFSHAHPDHLWGALADDGSARFPNASYGIAEAEWNFWMAPGLAANAPKEMVPFVTGAQKHLSAIKERMVMFRPGQELVPGLAVVDAAGHTPGHVAFNIAGNDGALLCADTVASPNAGFANPGWRFGFDFDPENAAASRRRLLSKASSERQRLIGYHWPYPGVGFAEARGTAFTFTAAP